MTSGSPNLQTTFVINGLQNGMGIAVAGAGAAGVPLVTTVLSGAGTVNLVLAANASTTVSGPASGVGSTDSVTTPTILTLTAPIPGLQNGQAITVPGAGSGGATLVTTVSANATTTSVTLATSALTTVSGAAVTTGGITGAGEITSGLTALTAKGVIPGLSNGMVISVAGAGATLASGVHASLNTTVASGEGTVNLVVANSASATVTGASIYGVGATVYEPGSISSTTNTTTLSVASTAGWSVGEGIDIAGAGAAARFSSAPSPPSIRQGRA